MIVMLDSSEAHFKIAAEELGCQVGQLLTPLTRYTDRGLVYGIDNGAFSGFDARAFRSLLARQSGDRDRCRFVCAPDVVGSARRTLEMFDIWYPQLAGWPVALVVQDGQENLPIRWDLISAVFIGGSTEFKISPDAKAIVDAAKIAEKWTHMGRVNTPDRFDLALSWGIDSIDGTGISRYSHMRRALSGARLPFEGHEEDQDGR